MKICYTRTFYLEVVVILVAVQVLVLVVAVVVLSVVGVIFEM